MRAMLGLSVVGAIALTLGACGGGGARTSADPLADMQDPALDVKARGEALAAARGVAAGDSTAAKGARRAFKTLAWNTNEPADLRVQAIAALMDDSDTSAAAEAREMGRLMLPRETSRAVVVHLCKTAGERGWTEYVPSIVRSYSRPSPMQVKEVERAEHIALRTLVPDRTVQQTAFELFVDPPEMPPAYGVDWRQRLRSDAWDVLARVDRDGDHRRTLVDRITATAQSDPLLANMAASVRELHALPLAGMELAWLTSLRDPAKKANAAWWSEASGAIGRLRAEHSANIGDAGLFNLRHVEAIRWASANRSAWLAMDAAALAGEIDRRLEGRRTATRKWGANEPPYREAFKHSRGTLRWADLLTILIVDEALRSEGVGAMLGKQAELDRKDSTTEYGGIVTVRAGGGFDGVLYPPRPGQRRGDQQFIASDDMLAASDRALAHYHFHAQSWSNSDYAGPSPEDLEYAAKSGRTCVVFTGVGEGVFGVDYYQPDGTVVDLGELRAR